MPPSRAGAALEGPEWLENFRAWAARQSSATLVELIDVLALELHGRPAATPARGEPADLARARQLVRVQQLVDDFLLTPSHPARGRRAPERMNRL